MRASIGGFNFFKMNDSETPLYLILSTARHVKLKAYAALNNQSMRNVIEDMIDGLSFDSNDRKDNKSQ